MSTTIDALPYTDTTIVNPIVITSGAVVGELFLVPVTTSID